MSQLTLEDQSEGTDPFVTARVGDSDVEMPDQDQVPAHDGEEDPTSIIASLRAQNKALEAQIKALEAQIKALEAQLEAEKKGKRDQQSGASNDTRTKKTRTKKKRSRKKRSRRTTTEVCLDSVCISSTTCIY